MKNYDKHHAESNVGVGIAYFEFKGDYVSRQIEIYGNKWFYAEEQYLTEIGLALCDQPLSEVGLNSEHKISAEEFENVWNQVLENPKSRKFN